MKIRGFQSAISIESGPRATVQRAIRSSDGAPVVLKVLTRDAPAPEDFGRFRSAARYGRDPKLPGVVHTLDLIEHEGRPVLVMEDIGGVALSKLLPSGGMDLTRALRVGVALAEGLTSLHEAGLVHRDLNPSNAVMNPDTGVVQIIDLDVVCPVTREAGAPQHAGTLLWLAPEQTGRTGGAVDTRADLYGLGTTLYALLTGEPPFQDDDPLGLIYRHLAVAPRPPHLLRADLPPVVSEIVLRLLAKAPGDRYQSARGVAHDLRLVLSALEGDLPLAGLQLGVADRPTELVFTHRLAGREAETRQLLESFETASAGRARLFLVKGTSGVGKTSLVRELQTPITGQRGRFVEGKYNQFQNVPASALLAALRQLMHDALSGDEARLVAQRQALTEALGNNGGVIEEVLPELTLLIGPQPVPPQLPPAEAQNRFFRTFQRFALAFARPEQPLVLFLDDLQWADPSSLQLLRQLFVDPDAANLLVIGAYRDNEVGPGHPLLHLIAELSEAGAPVDGVALTPLGPDAVGQIVADALREPPERITELTGFVSERSQGNPYFVEHLLQLLVDQGALRFESASGSWRWDRDRAAALRVSEDVGTLLAHKVDALPEATVRALQRAAVLGAVFDLGALSAVAQASSSALMEALWPAVREGLLVPVGEGWRFLGSVDDQEVRLRFAHDRVQEAALRGVTGRERQELHLNVGRLLARGPRRDELLMDIVAHLNRASELITDPAERLDLARLNLEAGRRARQTGAYDAAWNLFKIGTELISDAEDQALTYELYRDRAAAASESGRYDDARASCDVAHAHAASLVERTDITVIRLSVHSIRSEFAASVLTTIAALREFGLEPAADGAGWQALATDLMGRIAQEVAGSGVAALSEAPLLTDEGAREELRILAACAGAAMPDPPFFAWVTARSVWLSVRHGACVYSPPGYVYYGFLLVAFGQTEAGDAFGQVALRLAHRLNAPTALPPSHHIYGAYIAPRRHPLAEAHGHCVEAHRLGLEHGVFPSAGWAVANVPWLELWRGDELGGLCDRVIQHVKVAQRVLKNADVTRMLASTAHSALRLVGREADVEALEAQGLGVDAVLERLNHYEMAQAPSWTVRLEAAVVLQDAADMARALEVGPRLNAIDLLYSVFEFPFWQALALHDLKRLETEDGLAAWAACRERIAAHAVAMPGKFRCKQALLEGLERARLGEAAEALEHMDRAVAWAADDGQIAVEAQALERAAALVVHRPRLARLYLEDARLAYTRWGALARVHAMELAHPEIAPEAKSGPDTHTKIDIERLDVKTVLRASEALASEIHLDRLLTTLMRIVVESAGASQGCLLRGPDDALQGVAWAQGDQVGTGAAADVAYVPEVVAYVARTGERVLIADATRDLRYRSSPHVMSRRPRSILAIPLVHKGDLSAILYLENNLAPGAFSAGRVALLSLLSGLAATALENATLYDAQQRAAEELAQKNQQLTELDRVREDFLARTSHELRTPLHGIIGLADSLATGAAGPVSPDQRHTLGMIATSGRRLSNLVNDILDTSILNQRRIVLQTRPVALAPVIESVLSICRPLVGDRPVHLSSRVAPDLPAALADRDRLEQILHNLVGNAIKFTERGEVVVSAERLDDTLVVRVSDSGVGISEAAQAAIFSPFVQGEAGAARGGAGLGLSICSQLVALHGGRLTVSSALGRGSTFSFTLPLSPDLPSSMDPPSDVAQTPARVAQAPAPDPDPVASDPAPATRGPTILVVDDEPVNLRVLLLQLQQRGYSVQTASSGPDALRRIEGGLRPDLVLLDVMMPEMSGYEVCAVLRKRFPASELPVVMLTARSQPTDVVEGMGSGANDYVVKPFSSDELLARVRTHLQLAHLHQSVERFVPAEFLALLNRPSVVEVTKGDSVAREMTVLNADLRGFARILEQRPAEETFGFLNEYLGAVEPCIVANHGFVDRYVGASLTALFPGGPVHGLQAAVDILRAVESFNQARAAKGQAPVVPGIGLNAGHLLLGTVGGERHLDTTIVSEAVGVAERVASMTGRYNAGIIVTEAVIGAAPEALRASSRALDRLVLEGRNEAVTVYEVYEADPVPTRAAKDASRPSFEAAVRLFHDRSFTEAQRLFTLCQALHPMDQAVGQYLERCHRIQRSLLLMEP